MAKAVVADVIVPEFFAPYVIERSTKLTKFGDSEIVQRGPEFDALVSSGAKTVELPFWRGSAVSASSRQIISDSAAFSVNNITGAKDTARISHDGNAFSVTALAKYLSHDDPMMAIGEVIGQYWAEIDQQIILSCIKGLATLFDATAGDPNYLKIQSESVAATTEATKLNGSTFIDALQKLGDAADQLTGIAMHSATRSYLLKNDQIDFLPDSKGAPTIESFKGRRVIVTDEMTTRAGTTDGTVYTSVLFGQGAFGFGDENLNGVPLKGGFGTEAVEFARVPLNHDDVLINRRRWIKHPRGVAWQESASGAAAGGPTNLQMEAAAAWTAVWTDGYAAGVGGYKHIPIVAITHNN